MKKYRITVETEQGCKRYKVKAQPENIRAVADRMALLPYNKDEDGYCYPLKVINVSYEVIGG